MENPYKHPLVEQIQMALPNPLSEMGNMALQAFLELPKITMWHPKKLLLAELSYIFNIGLPFALLGKNPSAEAHRKKIANAIAHQEALPVDWWSEVQAGALLSNWGANVTFIKRETTPTPDLQANWGDESALDVEVTCAEIRVLHKSVQSGIQSLSEVLHASDVDWNVIVFLADGSDQNDLDAALSAVLALRPGEIKEKLHRWAVRAIPLEQREDIVGANTSQIFGPTWWPADQPTYITSQTIIGTLTSPVVQIQSLIPTTSYMNPVIRKAQSKQWHMDRPYLIAVNVSELPRAHERITEDLIGYFPDWSHVSGVMLFESRFWTGVGDKEWDVSIHSNPNARFKLPAQLTEMANGMCNAIRFNISQK